MTTDSIKEKKIYDIYRALVEGKQLKQTLMYDVRGYMSPTTSDLRLRFETTSNAKNKFMALYDNTCMNMLLEYSIGSLSDIVNPYVKWFSMEVKPTKKEYDEEALEEWARKARIDFSEYINKSSYYKSLITDKRNYDLYGFSGMTISTNKSGDGLMTKAEDPFKMLIYEDDDGIIGVFWENTYTAHTMDRKFGWKSKDNDEEDRAEQLYTVVTACVPNSKDFVNNPKEGSKYVQLHLLKSEERLEEQDIEKDQRQDLNDPFDGEEVGKRKYYDSLVCVVSRDMETTEHAYGEGWGVRLLTSAINLNKVHRNTVRSTEFVGNPPFQGPADSNVRFKKIIPGQYYQHSFTGNKIEPISFDAKLKDQELFLSTEQAQVARTLPSMGPPPQKKQRQSQLEVQKMLLETAKNSFIYKINYLKEGVTNQLRRMFRIAVKQGVVEKPPGDLTVEDVEPTLANLILKEFNKQQAMSYVEWMNMSYAFISQYPEGIDNFKLDFIIRSIGEAKGCDEGKESIDMVKKIRKERLDQQQKQQQDQLNAMRAELGLMGAQARKAGAEASKADAEAEEGAQRARI